MQKNNLSFSVIINTYNRELYLKDTLEALKFIRYENFEVIVVNGPSTDSTSSLLKAYPTVKYLEIDQLNLSASRNTGIKAASGEIVAFIDDDSIPEPEWLQNLSEGYIDETVAGVGGPVYNSDGSDFQCKHVTINDMGYATKWECPELVVNGQNGIEFPIIIGTNSSFRKSALIKVGGFDETYEYYHDEADLCLRLIRAGYKIVYLPKPTVHHKFARSHIRDKRAVVKNWYPIVKNTIYFGAKNRNSFSLKRPINQILLEGQKIPSLFCEYFSGRSSIKNLSYHLYSFLRGFAVGLLRGYLFPRQLRIDLSVNEHNRDFNKFNEFNIHSETKMKICLLSQSYPPEQIGGIALYTYNFAKKYAEYGHDVHVITKSTSSKSTIDWENGVWVHRLCINQYQWNVSSSYGTTQNILNYANEVYKTLKDINSRGSIDIVESPLFNAEGLLATFDQDFTVICRLESPLVKVIETQWKKYYNADLQIACDLEKEMLKRIDGVIAISKAIKQTVETDLSIDMDNYPNAVIPLGLQATENTQISISKAKKYINILFVGRLEGRKGIETLLSVLPKILEFYPNVTVTIAGDDSIINERGNTYKQEFLANKLNKDISARVSFRGYVNEEEKEILYQECDIFVAPSLYESFGLIYLEAMKHCKPVVATKCGGIPEIVANEETGLLVEPENIDDLFLALSRLIEDNDLREKLGQAGKRRFETLFTIDILAKKCIDFYQLVINSKENNN